MQNDQMQSKQGSAKQAQASMPRLSKPNYRIAFKNKSHDMEPPCCPTQSFYGGLLCCSWSVDSEFVATGGEDDLLSVYGLRDACVVAWGEGHSSYIS